MRLVVSLLVVLAAILALPVGRGLPSLRAPEAGPDAAAGRGADAANDPDAAVPPAAPADARVGADGDQAPLPIPADAKWSEIRVVREGTDEPVAGAEVTWFDERSRAAIDALPAEERELARREARRSEERR